jgi:hypothetical protein
MRAQLSYNRGREVEEISIAIILAAIVSTAVIAILRLIRDWKSEKRAAEIRADNDEALRDYSRDLAKRAALQTDMLGWLISEAKEGRWHVHPKALLQMVPQAERDVLEPTVQEQLKLDVPLTIELPSDLPGDPPHVGRFSQAS